MINRTRARPGLPRRILAGILATLVGALTGWTAPMDRAAADGRPLSILRDAEIEATIRAYADPIFRTAGLDPGGIRVLLVNDDRINAFVAGGMRLFINSGLLMQSDSANQVIGVIAHETGHISGGHLSRLQDELKNATIEQILGFILGAGVAVASGQAAAGLGTATLGTEIAKRKLLQYSRTQESAADQAGMSFLDATSQSSVGLLSFFEKLEGQEFLLGTPHDPYLRTHPLTPDRVDSVRQHVASSPLANTKDRPEFTEMHSRMVAKLKGYLWPLQRVEQDYPPSDPSIPARYARAIALFRVSRLDESLALMDGLLKDRPDDAFFLEQKGQILFENSRLAEALPFYTRAHDLHPQEPLLSLELAQVEIELEQPQLAEQAIHHLEDVVAVEPRNATAWYFLSIAYGRAGNLPMSALAQAEEAMARGDADEAWAQAKRALEGLPVGTPGWLKANDIINEAQQLRQDE